MLKTVTSLFKGRAAAPPAKVAARVDALYARALAAWNGGDWAIAAALCAEAIALDSALPVLHFMRASALLELGDNAGGGQAAAAGLALHPPPPLRRDLQLRQALAKSRLDMATGLGSTDAVPLPDAPASVSVIVCSISDAKLARVTSNYQRLLKGVPHDIIAIRDAKSLCEGYNRGARAARGDILVFSHDDLEILSEDFAAQLLDAMRDHDLIGVAGTTRLRRGKALCGGWPELQGQIGMPGDQGSIVVTFFNTPGRCSENIQTLDGVFMAARRELVSAVPFDEATFDGWHLYDMDFSWRASRAGRRCATLNTLLIVHQSSGNFGAEYQRYMARFLAKHGDAIEQGLEETQPELRALAVRSAEEWRRVTAHLMTTPN
ncbi:MAG TPA: glycosyltransferase [Burkholderiales bacterium]|nr:glycosyltransferase [Burkholderiales bacterium]